MEPKSQQGPLPLADAILAWSEPELLRAVEAAAVPFTPDQCDQHQREWLAEVIHYRLHPKDKRRDRVVPKYQALERAWHRLFAHFSGKVASGEIVLWGRMEWPLARRDAEPLPAAWADELLYYPRRDTVLFREDIYRDVTAGPRSTAGALEEELQKARSSAGSIPLAAALREWTDPTFLGEMCRLEREHTAYELSALTTHLLLSNARDLAQPTDRRWTLGPTDFTRLLSAWRLLENDFRARLVGGQFHLLGVMVEPQRAVESRAIPGVWAADLVFDFQRDAVRLGYARYVAVVVVWGQAPMDGRSEGVGTAAPNAMAGPGEWTGVPRQLPPITADSVRDLGDDEILRLLEEHGRRVVAGPDAKLIAPGKISLIPLLRRKMLARAAAGELLDTKAAEMGMLVAWLSSKIDHFQVPTPKAVGNVLGSEYQRLRAQSKGMKA